MTATDPRRQFPGLRQSGAHTEREALPAVKAVNVPCPRGDHNQGAMAGNAGQLIRAALDALTPVIVARLRR